MPFDIIKGDITTVHADAVVNAANTQLKEGSGVCGALFKAANNPALTQECQRIGQCEAGKAVVTLAYDLPAKYILHAVGPIWQDGEQGEAALLASAYQSALELAVDLQLESIAFPLISAGIFGFPADEAMHIATTTIGNFLKNSTMNVYLVLWDPPRPEERTG